MPAPDKKQGEFPETAQKDVLRAKDFVILQDLASRKARKLSYLGLAGVHAYDVMKWRELLDRVTVIERPIRDELARNEFRTKLTLGLMPTFNGNFSLIFADIWDFLASDGLAMMGRFPDVINLDFCGGLVNAIDMHYPKQRAAFQKIFETAQATGESFVLMLTLMPRDKGKITYKKYLNDNTDSLGSAFDADSRKLVEANARFHERDNLTLFKACLPILLTEVGRSHNYVVKTTYIKFYTKMIHLVFGCTFVRGVLGLPNDAGAMLNTLNLPIRKLEADGGEDVQWPPQVSLKTS